jgi:hypothetical protein
VTFFADANVPEPIIAALDAVRFDIRRTSELRPSTSTDRDVMGAVLEAGGILVTFDAGIPSQAYAYQFAERGLSVVLLRWKTSTPKDWQEIVAAILRGADSWRESTSNEPAVLSVSKRGTRIRPWSEIPSQIADQEPRTPL